MPSDRQPELDSQIKRRSGNSEPVQIRAGEGDAAELGLRS
ncbi:hypothetical protein ABIB51_003249 [Arthrobacter sp. UYCu712]